MVGCWLVGWLEEEGESYVRGGIDEMSGCVHISVSLVYINWFGLVGCWHGIWEVVRQEKGDGLIIVA